MALTSNLYAKKVNNICIANTANLNEVHYSSSLFKASCWGSSDRLKVILPFLITFKSSGVGQLQIVKVFYIDKMETVFL